MRNRTGPRESMCDHGYRPGECPEEGCLHRREVKNAILGLVGAMTAAGDQAQAMTDAELGQLLLSGRWSTIEVHEAGRRLIGRGPSSAAVRQHGSGGGVRPSDAPAQAEIEADMMDVRWPDEDDERA